MTKLLSITRRSFLQTSAIGAAAGLAPSFLSTPVFAQTPLTVGFIYVGPKDDYGYNQSHAEGAAVIKAMPGVTVVEEEKVPETVDVQKTMESMINLDGATLLFPTPSATSIPTCLPWPLSIPTSSFAIAAASGKKTRTR